jgi:hypothetical protein
VHLLQHGEFAEEGPQHVTFHANNQGVTGIGSLGNSYRFIQVQDSTQNTTPGAANEFTLETTLKAVSQGSEVDFSIQEVLHVTVNANGETTAEVFSFHVNCNG